MANSIYPDRRGARNANFRGGRFHNCHECRAKVWIGPVKARRHKRHFCDRNCLALWVSKNLRGEKIANFDGGPASRRCLTCRDQFTVSRGDLNRGHGKYCSRKCWRIAVTPPSRPCRHCGVGFKVYADKAETAKYCSVKCAHAGKRKLRTVREIAQRRLEVRIASLMGYSLKGRKAGCKWESLVGYTLADLMAHLESKFASGMTWANIGEWHIDHRRPRSSFKYASPRSSQFRACWALSNLQPLWAVDNMRKGARLDWAA